MSCVLRLSGPTFNVHGFLSSTGLSAYKDSRNDQVPSKVEAHGQELNYCSIDVSDKDFEDFEGQLKDADVFITMYAEKLSTIQAFSGTGPVNAVIDFGLSKNEGATPLRCFILPSHFMKLCGELCIDVELSVYWISERGA